MFSMVPPPVTVEGASSSFQVGFTALAGACSPQPNLSTHAPVMGEDMSLQKGPRSSQRRGDFHAGPPGLLAYLMVKNFGTCQRHSRENEVWGSNIYRGAIVKGRAGGGAWVDLHNFALVFPGFAHFPHVTGVQTKAGYSSFTTELFASQWLLGVFSDSQSTSLYPKSLTLAPSCRLRPLILRGCRRGRSTSG